MLTRLVYRSIAEIVDGSGQCIITLTDLEGRRALNVLCDDAAKLQHLMRNTPIKERKDRLVEVLGQVYLGDFRSGRFQIHIYDLSAGEYKTLLVDTMGYREYPIRLVDAVLLARVCDVNIFIRADLFMRQYMVYDPNAKRASLPLNILDTEKLEYELERAVNAEDYRFASLLHEELTRRKEELAKRKKESE